jgi:hypothetical protein
VVGPMPGSEMKTPAGSVERAGVAADECLFSR